MGAFPTKREVLSVGTYVLLGGIWFGYLKWDSDFHGFAIFILVVAAHVLFGWWLARWWGIFFPVLLLLLSVPAGHAGHQEIGDFNSVFDFVLITFPFAILASGVGYLLHRGWCRIRVRSKSESGRS